MAKIKLYKEYKPEEGKIDIAKAIFDNMMLSAVNVNFGGTRWENQESVDYWQTYFENLLRDISDPNAFAHMIDTHEFAYEKDSSGNWVAKF